MKAIKILIFSLIGGVLITLLTGLLSNTPALLLGAEHYGYPFAWILRLVLAPEYFPWRVDTLALAADVVIWTIPVGVALFAWAKIRH